MYSIIWLTRSLIRPRSVCGGCFGPAATALNLVLISGGLFVLVRAEAESAEECFVLDAADEDARSSHAFKADTRIPAAGSKVGSLDAEGRRGERAAEEGAGLLPHFPA